MVKSYLYSNGYISNNSRKICKLEFVDYNKQVQPKPEIKVIVVGVAILLVGGLVATGAYLMNKSYEEKSEVMARKLQPTISPIPTVVVTPSAATESATMLSPVVSIEGEQGMPAIARSELQKKIIEPFLDYYLEASQGAVLKLNVLQNTQANKNTYPYMAEAELEKNIKIGFVIEKFGTGLGWWKPECMGGCQYSKEFKSKYPGVVAP